ncbi:MAG: sulfatase [Pseudomonadota bacterium]
MTDLETIRLVGLVSLLVLGACGSTPTEVEVGVSAKPNVVVFFADDLGYADLGSSGHPYNRTPNLDRLAATGQRWTDFYVAAPVCSPSRGALLTGRLPNRTGLYGRQIAVMFPNALNGMPAGELTLAEALKAQGYTTGIIGKWHLGDAPDHLPTRHGFDYWFGPPYSNDMDWASGPSFVELAAKVAAEGPQAVREVFASRFEQYFNPKVAYWNVPIIRSQKDGDRFVDEVVERPAQQDLGTQRYTEEAIGFIERSKDQPFFLYVPYSMPHTPLFRSPTFEGRSLGGYYGDVIEELDWSVGQVTQALQDRGLAENTLVIFTSDNGPWLLMNTHAGSAGPLRDGKGTTFEGGMRVPAIFSWPGQIQPGVVSEIGSAMDIFSTVLSLAGVEPPEQLDGKDLSGTLLRRESSPRNGLFYYRSGELRAYRRGPFKLHLITEGAYQRPPVRTDHEEPLLYHLHNDPAERFDVSAQYPEVVAAMLSDIDAHRESLTEQPSIFDRQYSALR